MRRGDQRRWRFRTAGGQVIEVEVEPNDGWLLSTGERWEGVRVKARPFMRRKWSRSNIIGGTLDQTDEIEIVASRIAERAW